MMSPNNGMTVAELCVPKITQAMASGKGLPDLTWRRSCPVDRLTDTKEKTDADKTGHSD